MPGPCLSESPRISLNLVGSALTADVIPSANVGNGITLLPDGLYAPGFDDLLAAGFPTIPGSFPSDGDLWVKVAPQANVTWTFRYNGLSTVGSNHWEFIGGANYYADVETIGNISPSAGTGNYGAWQDLSGTDVHGPDFIAPFTGTYIFMFGADINCLPGEAAQVGLSIAGVDPTEDDTATASTNGYTSVMRAQMKAVNSGDLVRLNYRATGTGSAAHYQRRWLSVQPVRVGGTRAGGTYPGT